MIRYTRCSRLEPTANPAAAYAVAHQLTRYLNRTYDLDMTVELPRNEDPRLCWRLNADSFAELFELESKLSRDVIAQRLLSQARQHLHSPDEQAEVGFLL